MDVYTSYTIGITKKHDFYLMAHTGTLEIPFFKEIKAKANIVRTVFRKNYFKSQPLLESAAKTIRDTISISFYSVSRHGMFNPYPISAL